MNDYTIIIGKLIELRKQREDISVKITAAENALLLGLMDLSAKVFEAIEDECEESGK